MEYWNTGMMGTLTDGEQNLEFLSRPNLPLFHSSIIPVSLFHTKGEKRWLKSFT
jgi:hypothetical protein